MKTLTLFRDYTKAVNEYWLARGKASRAVDEETRKTRLELAAEHERQFMELEGILNKRLQEQEEELELLRMYYGVDKAEGDSELHIYVATDKGEENAELIQSNSHKSDEEGISGGSQDSQ